MTYAESGKRLVADPGAFLALESRFRRLLRWYPADYRAEREEEILATLMESAGPGQRRPGIRDTMDLALGALRARMRGSARNVPAGALPSAALPAAMILAMLLVIPVLDRIIAYTVGYRLVDAVLEGDNYLDKVAVQLADPRVIPSALLALALTVALATRRARLTRLLALLVALLPVAAEFAPYGISGLNLLRDNMLAVTLLALLVAAAPSGALARPRRQFLLLGLVAFVLPVVASAVSMLVSVSMSSTAMLDEAPQILLQMSGLAPVAALAAVVVLQARWRIARTWLATALLLIAMAPYLAAAVGLLAEPHGDPTATLVNAAASTVILTVVAARAIRWRKSLATA